MSKESSWAWGECRAPGAVLGPPFCVTYFCELGLGLGAWIKRESFFDLYWIEVCLTFTPAVTSEVVFIEIRFPCLRGNYVMNNIQNKEGEYYFKMSFVSGHWDVDYLNRDKRDVRNMFCITRLN